MKDNLRRVDSTLSKKWSFTILFGFRDNISIILYTLFRYNVANIYAYVYFSRFFPRRETNPPKERKKDFFLKQSIRTFETNFAIEKLVQTIKLIEYHLEDLGFRLDITSSIWAKHRYWPFSKLIPRNSISLRSVVDKFRTISTARSLIYVNTNALLYKLVERLPIVYHRVKMQRVKYNWQSFNLLSDFDIFFFSVTSFFKPLRFASHYRKYPLDARSSRGFAIVSKKRKYFTVCKYRRRNQFLRELHLENQYFRNYSINDNIN